MTEKQLEYTKIITMHLGDLFKSTSENFIDKNDFNEDDNATDFFYALNAASSFLYDSLTGDSVDLLGYNHICNRLICQNNQRDKNDK